jgi:hypothetical protein
MRPEDNVYRMPRLPTPTGEQVIVNKELIDAIRGLWNQLRDNRLELGSIKEQNDALRREIIRLKEVSGSSAASGTDLNSPVWLDDNEAGVALGTAASAPDPINWRGGTIIVRGFNGAGVLVESLYGGIEINHNHLVGSAILPHVHWAPVDATAGSVRWHLTYEILEGNDIISANTISVTQASPGIAWHEKRADFPAIPGTGLTFGEQMLFRLFRDPADPADTYGNDAAVLTLGIHYQVDQMGSRTLSIK